MAAYAALLSLSQTTNLNTTQNQPLFYSGAEEKLRSIHDYANFLILFFEEFPEKVKRWEVRIRDLAYKIEDIIEVFICQRIQHHQSLFSLEDQLENVMEEIGLIAGEVMEERPAYLPQSSSSSSTLAATGNDAVIGLDEDIMAIKERLCGYSSNLQIIPIVGMGGIENLAWNEKILQMIPNIKRLGLTYTINQDHHLHHLKDFHQLEKLEVIGYSGFSLREQNPSFPCTLKKLTLVGGGFPWKDMAIVGSLPNLEILKLLGNACDGDTWETTDEDFPQLKLLLIDESHLQYWITESNPFPTLKRLVLRSCPHLERIPEGIGEIPTLEQIEVDYCTNSLVESTKKIKEDQVSCGNDELQVVCAGQEIQSFYKRMVLSPSRPATSSNDAVIGLEDDVMTIKERLCGLSSKLQVVWIVGMSGIGKTTLARTVYCDPLILEYFEIRAWLTLSPGHSPLKLGNILLGILGSMEFLNEQISVEKIDKTEELLLTKVHQTLVGRRYLIVMDGVQRTGEWDSFEQNFPDDGNGSRLMFTTNEDFNANSSLFIHRMRFMTDYQGWDLLKQKVFGNRNCPPDLEDVGKQIARRCEGLPLSLVLIAGVLSAVDKTRASWNEIVNDVDHISGS